MFRKIDPKDREAASSYPIPADEEKRLGILAEYHMMDSPAEEDFDRLAALAAQLFDVPMVLVSLVGRDRQFFKTHLGLDVCETSREVSFCAHAIMSDDLFLIPDAAQDPRFASNPLVLGPPFIRFYAGKPLAAPTGEKIGTVCLIDTKPRHVFTADDRRNLDDLAALVMDRMEIRRLDHIRQVSQARFENIAATSPDAIICSDGEASISFWNPSAERLFGYSAEEMMGRKVGRIVPPSGRRSYQLELRHLRKGEPMPLAGRTVELSGLRKDGSEFPAEFSLSTWQEGNRTSVGAIVRDLSERRRNEERLFRLASLDALTELANRAAWRECLERTLAADEPATVLLLDLDGFKEVNDTLGHSAGDAVLKQVAARLEKACESAIMIARLGGDEFVVLMSGNDARRGRALAASLVDMISQPYDFNGHRCEIGVSIGVSLGPEHGAGGDELLNAADLALYRAKAGGKGAHRVFEPHFRQLAVARREFEQELRLAFENGEFELFYQPQVATTDRRLTGAEALLRWNHPERGLLTPASFIEVLSKKPSADAIGEWILRTACRQAAEWRRVFPDFRMSINLFEAQLRSGRLPTVMREALEENDLPGEAVELEILENILLHDDAGTLTLLRNLRALGCGLIKSEPEA